VRNPHQEHKLTLLTCNNGRMRCLYTRANALKAQLVGRSDYNPSSPSNIVDGIGGTIGAMRVYNARSESEQFHCTIFTSGVDDNSSKYTESMIASLIERPKKKGWIFSIVGVNDSVEQWARKMGINICCLVKSSDQSSRKEVVLKMLKRRWLKDHDHQVSIEDRSVEAA